MATPWSVSVSYLYHIYLADYHNVKFSRKIEIYYTCIFIYTFREYLNKLEVEKRQQENIIAELETDLHGAKSDRNELMSR